jgi:hypothetical protein
MQLIDPKKLRSKTTPCRATRSKWLSASAKSRPDSKCNNIRLKMLPNRSSADKSSVRILANAATASAVQLRTRMPLVARTIASTQPERIFTRGADEKVEYSVPSPNPRRGVYDSNSFPIDII